MSKFRLEIFLPLFAFLAAILAGFLLILIDHGKSSSASLILRFIALPATSLWLGIFLSNTKSRGDFLSSHGGRDFTFRLLLIAVFCYCLIMLSLKYLKLESLNYEFFDSGLLVNKFFRISQATFSEAWSIALFEGHFQPIILIFAWLYSLFDSPFFPFAVETLTLASGVIPLYMMANKCWGCSSSSAVLAICYLLNPVLQFNDILGFHPDHVVLPVLLWAFFFAFIGRYQAAVLTVTCLCVVGEQWIPLGASFGLFLIFEFQRYRLGLLTFFLFTVFFLFLIFVLMPMFGSTNAGQFLIQPSSPYSSLFNGDILETLLKLVEPRKLFFIFFLFFPFFFLPLGSWRIMIVAIPDLVKTLLSDDMLHFAVEGHYTVGLIAVIFTGYISTLKVLSKKYGSKIIKQISLVSLVTLFGLTFSHSPLPNSFNFWSEWSAGTFSYKNYMVSERTESFRRVEGMVGNDPELHIEVTNGGYTPALARRRLFLQLFPSPTWADADLIVLDKSKYRAAGSDLNQSSYELRLRDAWDGLLPAGFSKVYADDFVELWSQREEPYGGTVPKRLKENH